MKFRLTNDPFTNDSYLIHLNLKNGYTTETWVNERTKRVCARSRVWGNYYTYIEAQLVSFGARLVQE